MKTLTFVIAYIGLAIFTIALNLLVLAGAVWLVVTILQGMGVMS